MFRLRFSSGLQQSEYSCESFVEAIDAVALSLATWFHEIEDTVKVVFITIVQLDGNGNEKVRYRGTVYSKDAF